MYFDKNPFVVQLSKSLHLGDSISIIIILFNYCIKIKRPCIIQSFHQTIIDLIKLLNIKFIIPQFCPIFNDFNMSIADTINMKSNVLFLKNKYIFSSQEIMVDKIILPPIINNYERTYNYFQLDQKSNHDKKPLLTQDEKNNIFNKFKKQENFGIGGFDTEQLNGQNYKIGKLSYIFDEFKRCNYYFGIDSGMSHVAGLNKISGDVVITHTEQEDILDIRYFYNKFYPKLKCHSKKELIENSIPN